MKKRRIGIAVILAAVMIAVTAAVYWFTPRNLGEVYPALEKGTYSGYLKQGMTQNYDLPETMDSQTVGMLFQKAEVKRGNETRQEPEVAFCLKMVGEENLTIVVGQNGKIMLAQTGNLDDTWKYWQDDGRLFTALYDFYIQQEGEPLAE